MLKCCVVYFQVKNQQERRWRPTPRADRAAVLEGFWCEHKLPRKNTICYFTTVVEILRAWCTVWLSHVDKCIIISDDELFGVTGSSLTWRAWWPSCRMSSPRYLILPGVPPQHLQVSHHSTRQHDWFKWVHCVLNMRWDRRIETATERVRLAVAFQSYFIDIWQQHKIIVCHY